jgi:hypothetical protein
LSERHFTQAGNNLEVYIPQAFKVLLAAMNLLVLAGPSFFRVQGALGFANKIKTLVALGY